MTSTQGGYSTVCRLCNKEIVRATRSLAVPLEGQPDMQALQYLSMLQRHLKKTHPQNAAALDAATMEFGAMLLVQCFKVDDSTLTARADLIRDTFVNQFARQVSDAELDALIERVMSGNQTGEKILHREQAQEIVRGLRDLLTCRGKYAPKTEALQEAPMIVVP